MSHNEFLFTSERLGIRLLDDGDFEDLKKLDMDPEVRAHFPDGVSTPVEIQEWVSKSRTTYAEKGFAVFAVIELASGRFAGRAGFSSVS